MTPTVDEILTLTTQIVSAYLIAHPVEIAALPGLIREVHRSLSHLDGNRFVASASREAGRPAVDIQKSVFGDHLICLEDGIRMTMLKRHLRTVHGLTPAEYRAKWALPANYPMVAPNYAKTRSTLAKEMGLGKTR
jgi:predicted transcriptional regulator